LRIAAQRFDESELRKLCEQRLGAGPLGERFLHAEVKKIGEPSAFRDVAEWYAQHRRQRAAGAAVAGKIATG
jgi:hypothetical protein